MPWEQILKLLKPVPVWLLSISGIVFVATWVAVVAVFINSYQQGDVVHLGTFGSFSVSSSTGGSDNSLPVGSVIAFDLPAGCPKGWSEFTDGAGRFIIGVDGTKYKLPYVSGKPEYQKQGEETVSLSSAEISNHEHELSISITKAEASNYGLIDVINKPKALEHLYPLFLDRVLVEENGKKREKTRKSTQVNAPHNNMPPYIALYLCKKDVF